MAEVQLRSINQIGSVEAGRPHPKEPPPARLLRERVRTVFRELPRAVAGEEKAIHDMRVAGRRARVALAVLAPKPEGERVRRARRILKGVVRAAGVCRDLDVSQRLLAEHLAAADPSPETRLLGRRLAAARTRSRRRTAEVLLEQRIARLRKDLREILAGPRVDLATVQGRLREARDDTQREVVSAIETLGGTFEPDRLHDVRRKVRRLRYIAEVSTEFRYGDTEAVKELKKLQERLGRIHDAHVLAAWLGRQAAGAEARGQASLGAEARRLERGILDANREQHHAYLRSRPADGVTRTAALIAPSEPVAAAQA